MERSARTGNPGGAQGGWLNTSAWHGEMVVAPYAIQTSGGWYQLTNRDIILIHNTRILTPSEYHKLRKAMVDENRELVTEWQHQLADAMRRGDTTRINSLAAKIQNANKYPLMCDMLMHTGMRIVEAQALKPDMYRASRHVIADVKCNKVKSKSASRTIMLSLPGCDAVEEWLASGLTVPSRISMGETLRRYARISGIGAEGITPKMFRKTLASWLIACYPEQTQYIAKSMGHDLVTLNTHYLGVGFQRAEIEMMRELLKGWGVAV